MITGHSVLKLIIKEILFMRHIKQQYATMIFLKKIIRYKLYKT